MRPDGQEKEEKRLDQARPQGSDSTLDLWLHSLKRIVHPVAVQEGSGRAGEDPPGIPAWGPVSKLMQEPFHNIPSPAADFLPKLASIWGKEIIDSQFELLEKGVSFFTSVGQKDASQAWKAFCGKEVKRLLNLPQLGLTRYYQERSNQLLDRFNEWNRASIEFLNMISGPWDESFRMAQKQIKKGDRARRLAEGFRDIYRVWIHQLEILYQKLFRSPEFTKCLSDTLEAHENLVRARTEFFQDLCKALQLPTMKDLDDAYRELYQLKKEVHAIKNRKRQAQARNAKLKTARVMPGSRGQKRGSAVSKVSRSPANRLRAAVESSTAPPPRDNLQEE